MTARFVANHAGIASLTLPGGQVYRWVDRFTGTVENIARRNAPVGRGELRASIHRTPTSGLLSASRGQVRSAAPHSLWVHEGTTGPIRSTSGGVMPIHNRARTTVVAYRETVSGQRAQPFLARALNTTFARRGLRK